MTCIRAIKQPKPNNQEDKTMKERIFKQNYLEANKNQKAMMWLNLFVIMFCYIGTMLIISKHTSDIADMLEDDEEM